MIETRLGAIFRGVFRSPELVWRRELSAWDVRGWDSLSNIELLVAVEREFDLRFAPAETLKLQSAGDLADLILRKLSPRV